MAYLSRMVTEKSIFPVILSAGRATDIAAFYSSWFMNGLKKKQFIKINPFNGVKYEIKLDQTELIIFWTKNPKPFLQQLNNLDSLYPNYYFQFSLNDYDKIIEPGLQGIDERISTFISLSKKIGREKVIWRYDPLIYTDELTIDGLIEKLHKIAQNIKGYTDKFVFSFVDISNYKKVLRKIDQLKISLREFTEPEKIEFASKIKCFKEQYQLEISTCAEPGDFTKYGIDKNKCIDNKLIEKLFPENLNLMTYINQKENQKDKGQRKECGCIKSTDIGQYNTCLHHCVYCYANSSEKTVNNNYKLYLNDPLKPSIVNFES
jgi:DNA repair photolyase